MSPALLLLAAGGSTRMGRPKQLLPYRGTTLLRHAVDAAVSSRCSPILVVIGAHAAKMREELCGLPVQIVNNSDWAKGMGTSIRAGLRALSIDARPPAVVIMVCDQPAVTFEVLNRLIDRYQSDNAPIVASAYDGIAGVPALFDRTLFDELQRLSECAGARELIQRHIQVVRTVAFPQGAVDVDTPKEYEGLI